MLPSAFEALSNPCLPDFWIDTYTAAPGAITMAAAIVIFLIEYASTRYLARVDERLAQDAAATSFDPAGSKPIEEAKDRGHSNVQSDHYGHHHIIPPPIEGDRRAVRGALTGRPDRALERRLLRNSVS